MDNSRIFNLLNLQIPELNEVKAALDGNHVDEAYLALKRYYSRRTTPKLYFTDDEKSQIVDYVKQNCQHELDDIFLTADEVLEQTFVFRFPWDMERTLIPYTFEDSIKWDFTPFEDMEWTYMLNRHRYWIALGQAYAITGDEKYAKVLCSQMEHWIDSNPVPPPPIRHTPVWRTIEAGIRCENWIKSFAYVKDSVHFTNELLVKMLLTLHDHGQYLAEKFIGWRGISNWGVLESHGLFALSVFAPEFTLSAEWQELSMSRLKKTARLQVYKDGVHWEQSPMYHNEVLHCFMDNYILARNNNIEFDQTIIETAHKMLYADLYMAKPNHRQPLQGDSDDTDLRDLITTGAVLFEDSVLKFGGYSQLHFDQIWDLGLDGLRIYDQLEVKSPEQDSFALSASGNYFMRTGWNEEDLYLHFHCGPLGSNHGHADMLHIDIHAYGKDLLTDTGRYNYSDGTPLRGMLKHCSAHNTTMVDGIEFTEYLESWAYGRVAEPYGMQWISEPLFNYAEGGHTGYLHLDDPVYPLRRILFVKPNYWILIDSFRCKEQHTFTQRFHFPPGDIAIDPGNNVCYTLSPNEANLAIIPVHKDQSTAQIHEGYISYFYNQLESNKSVTYETVSSGFTSMVHILYPQKPGEAAYPNVETVEITDIYGDLVPSSAAEALRLTFTDSDEEHIILVTHKVPSVHEDSFIVSGVQVFGEVVVIKRSGNKEDIFVVK